MTVNYHRSLPCDWNRRSELLPQSGIDVKLPSFKSFSTNPLPRSAGVDYSPESTINYTSIGYKPNYKLTPTTTIEIVLLCTITDLIKALISVNTGVVLLQPFDDCVALQMWTCFVLY